MKRGVRSVTPIAKPQGSRENKSKVILDSAIELGDHTSPVWSHISTLMCQWLGSKILQAGHDAKCPRAVLRLFMVACKAVTKNHCSRDYHNIFAISLNTSLVSPLTFACLGRSCSSSLYAWIVRSISLGYLRHRPADVAQGVYTLYKLSNWSGDYILLDILANVINYCNFPFTNVEPRPSLACEVNSQPRKGNR